MKSTMQDMSLTVASILRHVTTNHATRRVITYMGDGPARTASYGEMEERCARLANALRRVGVTDDDRVATMLWNNQEHLEAYAAIPSMGAILHTLNIRLSPAQLQFVANHAEDKVVILDSSLIPLLAPVLPGLTTVRVVLVTGDGDISSLEGGDVTVLRYEEALAAESSVFSWVDPDERSAAGMCYTSGTTGDPKGVVYSHRSVFLHSMAACTGNALALEEADRVLPIVPMFHASAWGLPYASLMAGAELLMPDRYLQAAPLADMIQTHRPTKAGAVPTIWNDVLQYGAANPDVDLSSIDLVACGGAPVPQSLIQGFRDRFDVQIMQAWGMTETSPLATSGRPPAGTSLEDEMSFRKRQGRSICGVEMRLVDDDGLLVPRDDKSVGELEVRGPWVTGSYYRLDDADKFRDGWLRTGDVGHISPDGFLTLTDRTKDVIKSGGEWISSVELENLIMANPDVSEAAVVAMPDPRWQETALAVVVPAPGREVTADQLRTWFAENCPQEIPRWWIPRNWAFVHQVPRTSVGKFDKKVLRAQHERGELTVVVSD
ncbi:long-chain fatty acid--CoA ligase [Williamsia sp. SKLECPSW1]